MKTVPIVFSTDDNYVLPLCVAIKSIIDKKSKAYEYIIHIFHNGLSEQSISILSSFKYACKIKFVNVGDFLQGSSIYAKDRFPVAACFRFFISQILPEYEKVVYLDCDILANRDILQLYENDLGDNLVGAIKMIYPKSDNQTYFNSGVMVYNTKQFNAEKACDKCLDYLQNHRDLDFPDEQVLNDVCNGKVKYLPYEYNFQTWYCLHEDLLKKTKLKKIKDIVIIHYSAKPWNDANAPFADLWWKTAKTLPEEIYSLIEAKYKQTKRTGKLEYYKYYFANPIKKFFIKLKKKIIK